MCACELLRVTQQKCVYLLLQGWKGVCVCGTVSLLEKTYRWASELQGGVSMPEAGGGGRQGAGGSA